LFKSENAMQRFSLPLLCLLALSAQAHEGHGIEGASHYHASDIWGFVMALCVGVFIWWLNGRGK
jgi:Co/Zn/Cd efflux system component